MWTQQEFASHALPLFAFTECTQAKEFRKKRYNTFALFKEQ